MTEQTTEGLSREDIAAIRQADTVCFHHNRGQAVIRACLDRHIDNTTKAQRALFPRFHTEKDRDRVISVTAEVSGYEDRRYWTTEPNDTRAVCFYYGYASKLDPAWVTVTEALRPGDAIKLVWLAGNDSDNMRRAGMHRDELRVEVTPAKGRKRTYLVAVSVGPDNSARMIKRHGD